MSDRLTKERYQLRRLVGKLGINLSGLTPLQRARLTGTVKPKPVPRIKPEEVVDASSQYYAPPRPEELLDAPLPTDMQAALSEISRFKESLRHLAERGRVAYDLIQVLREANAREKAARAVVQAQLTDKRALDSAGAYTAALRALNQEQAQLSAAIKSEHNALRGLVAALYQTAFPDQTVPDDLTKPANQNQVRVSETHNPDNYLDPGDILPPPPPDPRVDWHKYLRGKICGQTLMAPNGQPIITQGESITAESIKAAQESGQLFTLMLHMQLSIQSQVGVPAPKQPSRPLVDDATPN